MIRTAGRAVQVLALLSVVATEIQGQDTVVRRVLPLDTARMQPFRRSYDMVVHTRDSAVVIGQRDVILEPATYASAPAWRLVETRSGIVPAAETLYVSTAVTPLQWSAVQGTAHLGATFVGDSIFGAVATPGARQSMIAAGRPDLLVSQAMLDAVLPLLALSAEWSDSVGVLAADMAGVAVVASELAVIGEEYTMLDAVTARPAWVVALRADLRTVLLWVDKDNGETLRVQQPAPLHVGTLLEYRRRPGPPPA